MVLLFPPRIASSLLFSAKKVDTIIARESLHDRCQRETLKCLSGRTVIMYLPPLSNLFSAL